MKLKLFLFAMAVILLATAAIPAWIRARTRSCPVSCIHILRQIDAAKYQWALENHRRLDDVPKWEDVEPYLKSDSRCPQGGTYTLGRIRDLPTCSKEGNVHSLPPRVEGDLDGLEPRLSNATPPKPN